MAFVREKPASTYCLYCYFYRYAPRHHTTMVGEKIRRVEKFCTKKSDYVMGEETSCQHFKLNKYVWCDTSNCHLSFNICLSRHQNDSECNTCKQIKHIRVAIDIDRAKNWKENFRRG